MKTLFSDLFSNFSGICTKLVINDNLSLFSFLIDGCKYIYNIFECKTLPFSVYLKGICTTLIMMAVFGFVIAWMMKAKPHRRPLRYLRHGHNSHQKINLVSKHTLDTSWPVIASHTVVVHGKLVHKHT